MGRLVSRTALTDAQEGSLRTAAENSWDEARQRAELLRPILAEWAGMTARAIARELNAREVF